MKQITHSDAPGWQFTVSERSAGVLQMEGRDQAGRSVSRTGCDYDALLKQCVADARAISARDRSS